MLGLYVHIPYCLQRCSYCDFATYVHDQIMSPDLYVDLLVKELQQRRHLFPGTSLTSIYFGGGTPSLLSAEQILRILNAAEQIGLHISNSTEITIEINPATLDAKKIKTLVRGGVNRFSVGAQTFNDALLKKAGRKHSAQDTMDTLDLLREEQLNYSFDLLFALPQQSLEELDRDLEIICEVRPPHLSAYCLTVPTGHPMSHNRPSDENQVKMFENIHARLQTIGLERYEISNFARRGSESRHNLLYWQDEPYLGIGLSAHSYLKHLGPWGTRFWNPSSIDQYAAFINAGHAEPVDSLVDMKHGEGLTEDSSLFDFCHTSLRLDAGLDKKALENKFSSNLLGDTKSKLQRLREKGLLVENDNTWRLSPEGVLISNYVFSQLN